MNDAIVISDLHLGSDICQAKLLESFLKDIHHDNLQTKQLILNGDVFDSWDFRRLNKHHWRVLSLIRKLSDHVLTTWISGNHDGPAELISHLLGVNVVNQYSIKSANSNILFHHGHRYDQFIDNHVTLTYLADCVYWVLQKLDSSFALARAAKRASKTFMRNSEIIRQKSLEYAKKHGYDAVCTGHTHFALSQPGEIGYYNSGCWTELPTTFLTIKDGIIQLNSYENTNHN